MEMALAMATLNGMALAEFNGNIVFIGIKYAVSLCHIQWKYIRFIGIKYAGNGYGRIEWQ